MKNRINKTNNILSSFL